VRHTEIGDAAGQRVDNYLLRELAGVPRSRVYRMLRKGEVRINGRRVAPDYRLAAGDTIRIPPWHGSAREPKTPAPGLVARLTASLIYEDADLLVLNKPAGIAVHGGSGVDVGVIEALRGRSGEARLALAHRIDRDTSGILLLARRRSALVELHAAFREGRVRKTYDVLVHGHWPRRQRTVQVPLHRFLAGGERRVKVDLAQGKPARTDFELHDARHAASWIRAFPHTGRTHQIRVHCASLGHPVVGDVKYAGDERIAAARRAGVTRLCLHATALTVSIRGVQHRFEAPLPDDFAAAWALLSTS
jgi:23S rRNA pseudouridine955/2504/2580 synthase